MERLEQFSAEMSDTSDTIDSNETVTDPLEKLKTSIEAINARLTQVEQEIQHMSRILRMFNQKFQTEHEERTASQESMYTLVCSIHSACALFLREQVPP